MRRTTFGLAGLAVLVVSASAVVAQGFAPAPNRAAAPRPAVSAAPASPPAAQGLSASADQPTTLLDSVGAAVPTFTQLVSAKSSAGFVYWYDPAQPVIGQIGGTTPWGGPTVLPVVKTKGDWLQVRLPSRPNGSTAWVRRQDVTVTTTGYRLVISVSQRSLTIYQNGQPSYAAPVGVGRTQWPTPLGPSFVDALVPVPLRQQRIYGPIIVMTGSHSDVFTTFDGGDGIVGIHGYPSDPASTAGVASSHGCIRASPQTMAAIGQVPPGTPIDIVP